MCVELTRRGFLRTAVSATGMLAAAGVLAACGSVPAASSVGPAAHSAPVTSSSPPAANAASAAPPSAAAAASHGELKLGILANTSGPFAAIGDDMNRATELYLEQHGGSLGGFKFTVIREDEGASPADALSKARKLMQQDHVDVLMGIVLSSTALALRDPSRRRSCRRSSPTPAPLSSVPPTKARTSFVRPSRTGRPAPHCPNGPTTTPARRRWLWHRITPPATSAPLPLWKPSSKAAVRLPIRFTRR